MLNLTPHAINFQTQDGSVVSFPPSGVVARVSSSSEAFGAVLSEGFSGISIPVVINIQGVVEGVPSLPCEPFLVSGMVLDALPLEYRGTAFAPATGPQDGAVRNDKGHIIAVTKFRTR